MFAIFIDCRNCFAVFVNKTYKSLFAVLFQTRHFLDRLIISRINIEIRIKKVYII